MLPSQIHQQICQVFCDNAMSDDVDRKCVRMLNEGRENVHDEARRGRPFLVNEDLARIFNQTVGSERCFKISELSCTFLIFKGLYSMTLPVVPNIADGRILCGWYTQTCAPLS